MSYESKLDSAILLIQDHNSVLQTLDKSPILIDKEKFIYGVKVSGGTSEVSLKHFTHEDICRILLESYEEGSGTLGIIQSNPRNHNPIALARSICEKFRSVEQVEIESSESLSAKKIRGLSIEELCRRYNPNDPSSLIYLKLKDMSGGKAFLVFDDDNKPIADYSTKLLRELLDGYPPRDVYVVGNDSYKVYKVGEKPSRVLDENPIFIGRVLRPDGSCDQTNRSWEGVPLEIRQLVRLIAQSTEVNLQFAHDIMDMVVEPDVPKRLLVRYPVVAAKFREQKKIGNLPTLKISSINTIGKFPVGKPVKI